MAHNLIFGWVWICVGFISGTLLGIYFHDEKWLGGYGSYERRLIRLGHISFLGLGILNILFFLSLASRPVDAQLVFWASWLFIIGGVTMPVCCGLMTWKKELHLIFAVPVISLTTAAILTTLLIAK